MGDQLAGTCALRRSGSPRSHLLSDILPWNVSSVMRGNLHDSSFSYHSIKQRQGCLKQIPLQLQSLLQTRIKGLVWKLHVNLLRHPTIIIFRWQAVTLVVERQLLPLFVREDSVENVTLDVTHDEWIAAAAQLVNKKYGRCSQSTNFPVQMCRELSLESTTRETMLRAPNFFPIRQC